MRDLGNLGMTEAEVLSGIRGYIYWPLEISLSPSALKEVELAVREQLDSYCASSLSMREDTRTELQNLANIIRAHLQTVAAEADPLQRQRDELEFHLSLLDLDRTSSMLTPDDLSKLQLYRARIQAGEQMPIEEMREAMKLLRSDRVTAAKRAQASKAKSGTKAAKAPARSANELLGKLGIPGLGS